MTVQDMAFLIDWLRRQHLLSAEKLAEVTDTLQPRFSDVAALVAELQRRRWLTPFQAERFAQGEGIRLGRYLLLDRLGRGGQGDVFKGWDPTMNRMVALKVLRTG